MVPSSSNSRSVSQIWESIIQYQCRFFTEFLDLPDLPVKDDSLIKEETGLRALHLRLIRQHPPFWEQTDRKKIDVPPFHEYRS